MEKVKSISYVNAKITKLKKFATKNGLVIKFRNFPTMAGDFCIFIYDLSYRKSYTVGFDGVNSQKYGCTFNQCVKQSYNWIRNRDSRFRKEKDKWVVA